MKTVKRRALCFAALIIGGLPALPATATDLVRLNYTGFTLWMDCVQRGAVAAYYQIGPDTGNFDTKLGFRIDEEYRDCQQTSTETYKMPKDSEHQYDRGHIVPANHLDSSEDAYRASYLMTNVVPQHRKLNRKGGAWRKTEDLIECWREDGLLEIWIGVLWGYDGSNDHFVQSHRVATPDAFVKLVYRRTLSEAGGQAIAWFLPNKFIPGGRLNDKVVPPEVVEAVIGRVLNLPGVDKARRANPDDWQDSTTCDP